MSTSRRLRRLLALFAICQFLAAAASAAPPKLNHFFPAGAQRGQSVSVTAAGDFSAWPVQGWADRPGLTLTAEKDKGKLNIAAAPDAIPGIYWIRLYNGEGASALKPFVVGTLPEVNEVEPNDSPDKPQAIEPRVVVNGKLGKAGDVDGYRVELKTGQTLVAAVQGNSILGSPMDAVLQTCELVPRPYSVASGVREHPGDSDLPVGPKNREANASRSPDEAFVVAQNHDAVGIDPQVVFTAPHDGTYLVRLFAFPATPDSGVRFAGGDDYVYRLTLTTGPYLDHALPLAVPREESQVQLGGWNLDAATTATVPPLSAEHDPLTPPDGPLAWVWHPRATGAVLVPRVDHTTVTFARSITASIPVPATISGRLEKASDADTFIFQGNKDKKLRIRVAAKALGFPTDAFVTVLDESGKLLAEADDTGRDDRDPVLDFTPPGDGMYRLIIHDLSHRGGPRMVYRLTLESVQPDFSLTLAADSFVLERGKPLEIPINVTARDGFREAIDIHCIGLPPGVTAEPLQYQPTGDSPMANSGVGRRGRGNTQTTTGPSTKLILKSDPAAVQAGGTAIRIEGRTVGAASLARSARFPLNLPLAVPHHAAWLTVK